MLHIVVAIVKFPVIAICWSVVFSSNVALDILSNFDALQQTTSESAVNGNHSSSLFTCTGKGVEKRKLNSNTIVSG